MFNYIPPSSVIDFSCSTKRTLHLAVSFILHSKLDRNSFEIEGRRVQLFTFPVYSTHELNFTSSDSLWMLAKALFPTPPSLIKTAAFRNHLIIDYGERTEQSLFCRMLLCASPLGHSPTCRESQFSPSDKGPS
ncbi:hypothetical protein CEXT_93911 [Caerostris extrusa]|uniref:Uncharacterized protein n=1 Tax=Caerostris extrusa TaxID=172846 RepID=A0AAV4TFL0_CAEEX|nr:hypothetical protein CEXT_93911 [Caerostris extrusa]